MNIGVIIQARMGSTRLKGKILKSLPINSDITVLQQVIRRVRASLKVNCIIIATTESAQDNAIVDIAIKEKAKYFRGSEDDVLSRYFFAAKENNLDIIARITSDCPCIDPETIDYVVEAFIESDCDYVSNALERTYPRGLDVEVFSFKALKKAFDESSKSFDREHVTPYMHMNRNIFKVKNIIAPVKLNNPNIRITVDTYDDYMLLSAIYDYLYKDNILFKAEEIVSLFESKPWLYLLSMDVVQKTFDSLEEEINEAKRIISAHHMDRAKEVLSEFLNSINAK
ncbi:MAG: glycosyltransferase family protein [Bacillota bacterium]|nr:glycosyltransferase family protein [Bacillota bacterium]